MTIGEIIKDYRTEHNMSYEEFAKNADSVNPMFMRSRKTNIQNERADCSVSWYYYSNFDGHKHPRYQFVSISRRCISWNGIP